MFCGSFGKRGSLKPKEILTFIFPIVVWLPRYNFSKLRCDIIAGFTLGLMTVSSSLAFVNIASLPPEYGLYAALTPGITYAIFGTSKDISVGPGVMTALFTARSNPFDIPIAASILAFFSGIVLVLMAVLRLGVITKFIPPHVLSAFMSAVSINLITTELRGVFGLTYIQPKEFFSKPVEFFANLQTINLWDLSLSIFCFIYLGLFMFLSGKHIGKSGISRGMLKEIVCQVFWFLCVARNALICVLSAIIVYIFVTNGYRNQFTLIGKLPNGLPPPKFPLQAYETADNKTITTAKSFEMYGTTLLVLPAIQYVQSIAIVKSFGKLYQYQTDSTQEMIAIGMSNVIGSFFGGWPVCGGFSKSAVNAMSGAKTPISGAFSSVLVIVCTVWLTPVFVYIPKACLSSMVIMAVIKLINLRLPYAIWKSNKLDIVPYLLTLFGTLYKIEAGVIAGAFASLLLMVIREITPEFEVSFKESGSNIDIVFKRTPSYPCIELLETRFSEVLSSDVRAIEIDMEKVSALDFPVILLLQKLIKELKKTGKVVKMRNFSNERLEKLFITKEKEISAEVENNEITNAEEKNALLKENGTVAALS